MKIRPATPSDYPALADLWFDSWVSIGISNETDLSREGVRERFFREASEVWNLYTAERDGVLVGLLALVPEQSRIDQLFVAPAAKGGGVGLAMLNHAKALMPGGIVLTTHEANSPARAFYESRGFVLTGTEPDLVHRRTKCHYAWRPVAPA
nr:GNAT family N-acetyltransferase [uncultured Hyphomonas sp.]